MIFTHKLWEMLCTELQRNGIHSIPACEVAADTGSYLVLKHDVETEVRKAYQIACIESRLGHRGSYYVQAYLLKNEKNVRMLRKIQEMGHEVSYHYDVMDSCKGNLTQAISEFEENRNLFEKRGFPVRTVCQHGNPVVTRVGYASNRDFFRSEKVRALYPGMKDIMVNFQQDVPTEYRYFSDAGRRFHLIYDPVNNDLVCSDDKNILVDTLEKLLEYIRTESCIVSIHPHRWTKSGAQYLIRTAIFKTVKKIAKILIKIPIFKKIMSRYYHLAKKI